MGCGWEVVGSSLTFETNPPAPALEAAGQFTAESGFSTLNHPSQTTGQKPQLSAGLQEDSVNKQLCAH